MLCHRIKQCCPSFISIETMELPFVETGDACHQWESADDVHAWLDGILRAIWFFDEEQCVECVPLVLSYLPHDRTVYSYFQYYFDLRLMWKVCVLLFFKGLWNATLITLKENKKLFEDTKHYFNRFSKEEEESK